MTYDDDGYWWESYLTQEEWARMPASKRMWYAPDSTEETEDRLEAAHEMGLAAHGFVLSTLTPRQRQVVELYCLEGQTQVKVATALGISQATVSQHLMGKLRGGHHVGGAFRKIRKAIRKAAKTRAGEDTRHAQILAVFDELLDSSITWYRVNELIETLARRRSSDG